MRVNLERGFRRITWVLSSAVFVLGSVMVVHIAEKKLADWDRAGELPVVPHASQVYVVGRGALYVPSNWTAAEIKKALDDKGGQEKLATEKAEPYKWDDLERHPQAVVEEGAAANPKDRTKELDKRRALRGPDLIAFVYPPSSGVLYSIKDILQAEAKGQLTLEERTALAKLRREYHANYLQPVSNPFSFWLVMIGVCFPFGVAVIPWGALFLIRWIGHGFQADS